MLVFFVFSGIDLCLTWFIKIKISDNHNTDEVIQKSKYSTLEELKRKVALPRDSSIMNCADIVTEELLKIFILDKEDENTYVANHLGGLFGIFYKVIVSGSATFIS